MRTSFDEPVEMAAVMPPEETLQEETKKCPFCAERILAEAIKCRYCGEFLTPPTFRPASKSGGKWYQSTATIVLALLTLGPLALPLVWKTPRYKPIVKVFITIGVVSVTIGLCYAMVGMYSYLMNQLKSLGI